MGMQGHALGAGKIKSAYKGKGSQHPAGIAYCYMALHVCMWQNLQQKFSDTQCGQI